jgi:hypothetical protein
MAREKQQAFLPFPMKGIARTLLKNLQPEGTCFDAQNVRPYDDIEGRIRGGSRPGLAKYNSTAITDDTRIQNISSVVTVNAAATGVNRREVTSVAVANGVIKRFTTDTVTAATPSGIISLGNTSQSPFIFSTELFGKLYFADGIGYKVYDPENNTATDWNPTAGVLPGANTSSHISGTTTYPNGTARLIDTWRGRIVLAGLPTDPHNWFMSRLGDADDWDYAPEAPDGTDAIAGGVGRVGKVPDIITSLIPFTDDVLLLGCDRSIYMISGDPLEGGSIDQISRTIGIAFGRAFCHMPDGSIIFFSTRGSIYRMNTGSGQLTSLTELSIEPLLIDIDIDNHVIHMTYEEFAEGVHVYITPLETGAATHWFYDVRNHGWFKVVFGHNNYNPVTHDLLDGKSLGERTLLLGGEDGYIRRYEKGSASDDGDAFTSFVIMGPVTHESGSKPIVITDLQFVMDEQSNNTIYEVRVGDTPEDALTAFTEDFDGDVDLAGNTYAILAGKSLNYAPRKRGYFGYYKLGATAPSRWAIEYIQTSYQTVASSRGRVLLTEEIDYTPPEPQIGEAIEFDPDFEFDPLWTPAQLFDPLTDGLWYDPSDLTTMFQDSAGTTPVTGVGQPVGLLQDKSGNNFHASQSTASKRPILRRTDAGCWYLEFDGVDDALEITATAEALVRNKPRFTFMAGVERTGGGIAGTVFTASIGTVSQGHEPRAALYKDTAPSMRVAGRRLDGEDALTYTRADTIGTSLLGAYFDYGNAEMQIYRNRVRTTALSTFESAGSTSDTDSVRVMLGSDGTDDGYFGGKLFGLVAVDDNIEDHRTNLEGYLGTKSCLIPVPPFPKRTIDFPWTPTDMFSAFDGFWYDPSDMSTMFQDAAGTVPVTAIGQKVGRINDKSGNGHHAVQADNDRRPTLSLDDNDKPYLGFFRTNPDQLSMDATAGDMLKAVDGFTLWFAGRRGGGTGDQFVFLATIPDELTGTHQFRVSHAGSPTGDWTISRVFRAAPTATVGPHSIDGGTGLVEHTFGLVVNYAAGSDLMLYNGTVERTGSFTPTTSMDVTSPNVRVGDVTNTSLFNFNGRVHGMVGVVRALELDDRLLLDKYLQIKAGLQADDPDFHWTPAALFVSDGFWYDSFDIDNMFQDVDGTLPVTQPGQFVARINDKSGNSRHAFQPDESLRPTIEVTEDGYPYLQFDGVDDFLSLDNTAADLTKEVGFTNIYTAMQRSAGNRIFSFTTGSSDQDLRAGILFDNAVSVRVGGRRLDGNSFQSLAVEVEPASANVIGGELDYESAVARINLNGDLTSTAFHVSGVTSNTDSQVVRIGSFEDADGNVNGVDARIWQALAFVGDISDFRDDLTGYMQLASNLVPVPWSPHNLFDAHPDAQGFWFDPSDLSTMWTDPEGLVQVTAADTAVARIDDKSGNRLHAIQSESARRPILRNSGGQWWLEFDGTDDFMTLVSAADGVARAIGHFNVFSGSRREGGSESGRIFFASSGISALAPRVAIGQMDNTDFTAWGRRLDDHNLQSHAVAITAGDQVLGAHYNFAEARLTTFFDGTQADRPEDFHTVGITSNTGSLSVNVGARGAGDQLWGGRLYELVSIAADIRDQHDDLVEYLESKVDFTEPSPPTPSPFDPSDLFTDGSDGFWFDPADRSTLFRDPTGTIPVTGAGQQVRRVNDKSGNGRHAVFPHSGSAPTLRREPGGSWYLDMRTADGRVLSMTNTSSNLLRNVGAFTLASGNITLRAFDPSPRAIIFATHRQPWQSNIEHVTFALRVRHFENSDQAISVWAGVGTTGSERFTRTTNVKAGAAHHRSDLKLVTVHMVDYASGDYKFRNNGIGNDIPGVNQPSSGTRNVDMAIGIESMSNIFGLIGVVKDASASFDDLHTYFQSRMGIL